MIPAPHLIDLPSGGPADLACQLTAILLMGYNADGRWVHVAWVIGRISSPLQEYAMHGSGMVGGLEWPARYPIAGRLRRQAMGGLFTLTGPKSPCDLDSANLHHGQYAWVCGSPMCCVRK
jgi:hypothetical protein